MFVYVEYYLVYIAFANKGGALENPMCSLRHKDYNRFYGGIIDMKINSGHNEFLWKMTLGIFTFAMI